MRKLIFIGIFVINFVLFSLFFVTQKFPAPFLLLHLITLIMLFAWTVDIKAVFAFMRKNRLDLLLLICLFFIAFGIRMYKVEEITPGMYGDEFVIAKESERILSLPEYIPFTEVSVGHPTLLLYMTGICIELFGRTLTAIRLPYIFFGALCISAFYILLRLFFGKSISFATSLLLAFSYPLVAVSRLAYEITPSLFFQILTTIFLFLAWKLKSIRFYVAAGLSLGAGLYTYLGFRTFALLVLLLAAYLLLFKPTKNRKLNRQAFLALIAALFIAIVPLFSYGLGHIGAIMERTNTISLFNQNLSSTEFLKELSGSTFRLTHLFFSNGDPNPRYNPSGVSMFDIVTVVIALSGLIIFI